MRKIRGASKRNKRNKIGIKEEEERSKRGIKEK